MKYSSSIFLIVTVAIFLQVIFNLEAIRYTLYTGEPIYGGIMRLRPGPKFWAGFYTIIGARLCRPGPLLRRHRRAHARILRLDHAGFGVRFPAVQNPTRQYRHPGAHGNRCAVDGQPGFAEKSGGVRRIYYSILVAFSFWGALALWLASPMKLFTFLANIAGVVLVIAGIQILIVNRSFLPRPLRPPLWREVALLACSLFYAFFTFFMIRSIIST